MTTKIKIDEYKIVTSDTDNVLFISENFEAELKNPVSLIFSNAPFIIELEENGQLNKIKDLKKIILVVSDCLGNPRDFFDLNISEILYV